ncbi:DUF1513 domain-containing protein [Hyphomicrobium sp.]|uniref:DUF1513 domain-containing protein n=1 Tax=Hyphomicrobium sp. TaxID=82 RepID=UPI002E355BDE|nr:DUF1513 domain-containing protein [Hyphomicrobium sp.]HEX2840093.1 DUF1513 domain-containing protein [Hyphomicrobium sp.]
MPKSKWGSTSSMAIDRRQFLIGSMVALGAARHALAAEGLSGAATAVYASGARRPDGSYAVLLIAEDGRLLREIPLSARCHDIAIDHVARLGVVFARRPGFFALAFDADGRREPEVFAPPPDRHFYGHGVFSKDGRLVYATEHNVDTGDGIIGVYDAAGGWRRVGEFPSYGIGPHEAILLSDGKTLAIANGGFGNDPATGRESIGVADMAPNVAFVDVTSGALKVRHEVPSDINLLSVRHLAETPRGDIWFGSQWQGGLEDTPALIGRVGLDRPIALMVQADALGMALKGYIGAVAVSADGRLLAASAPLAGRVVYADAETGKIVHDVRIKDSSGLTLGSGGSEFVMSSGEGALRFESDDSNSQKILNFAGAEFDNHIRRV